MHSGETGSNLICHFGLDVPEGDLEMVVDGEGRKWKNNEGILFNDAYPHFSYNNTPHERAILLIEHWNPVVPKEVRPLLSTFVHIWSCVAPKRIYQLHKVEQNFEYNIGGWVEKLSAVTKSRADWEIMDAHQDPDTAQRSSRTIKVTQGAEKDSACMIGAFSPLQAVACGALIASALVASGCIHFLRRRSTK